MTSTTSKLRKDESGNALFLILIAVALFAALSYAVTQSGRGSGSIGRETGMIDSSRMTQYPASLRTAVTRLILTGTAITALTFDPADVSGDGVFSSIGGGVVFQAPPAGAVDTTAVDATFAGPDWRYKSVPTDAAKGYYILGIGSDVLTTGRDGFAFVGVTSTTCQSINKGLGLIATAAPETTALVTTADADEGLPSEAGGGIAGDPAVIADVGVIGDGQVATNTNPQPFGCVDNTLGANVYYHALIEQ